MATRRARSFLLVGLLAIPAALLLAAPFTAWARSQGIGRWGAAPALNGRAPDAVSPVSMVNFQFIPASLTINTGDTVTWTNNTAATNHTTTSDTGVWDSGTLTPGVSFSFTFTQTGTFAYHCTFHQALGMVGTIIVVNPPTATPTNTATATRTRAPTRTRTPTATSTVGGPSPTPTLTRRPTRTPTNTPGGPTPTPTRTRPPTRTPTATPTPT
jgi:plastocyanin